MAKASGKDSIHSDDFAHDSSASDSHTRFAATDAAHAQQIAALDKRIETFQNTIWKAVTVVLAVLGTLVGIVTTMAGFWADAQDKRLARFETTITGISADVNTLKTDTAVIKVQQAPVDAFRAEIRAMQSKLDRLEVQVQQLKP